jgi:hypothetical protein
MWGQPHRLPPRFCAEPKVESSRNVAGEFKNRRQKGGGSLKASRYNFTSRSRKALPTTDTELKLIAAAAIMGLSSTPKNG